MFYEDCLFWVCMGPPQDFEVPDELSNVKNYMMAAFSLDIFKNTQYPEESIVNGWAVHLGA